MSVKTYSLKKDANLILGLYFKVKEFKCRDGSDEVKIDDALIKILQNVRDHFKKAVHIVSGYRSPSYNSSIGGAKASQHMYGKAADIQITGVNPRDIAIYLESIGAKGLGLYDYADGGGFVHVDTRLLRARWLQTSRNGGAVSVKGFYAKTIDKPTLKYKSRGVAVSDLQKALNIKGFDCGVIDGVFGKNTLEAVKAFQKANGLVVDGIFGPASWNKL